MQRVGFEPTNHYGLGPKPSAFDQARLPLRKYSDTYHGQNYYTQKLAKNQPDEREYP